ncbi:MAG: bifunctional phosphopantothenoylcysteine decarboxylase/phosphopantothenate--cysteine ligase CoaBC [bacterium]
MNKEKSLKGKKIVLGVTGGIAAYKSVYLLRLLVEKGADVQVVGTANSLNFIGESTWCALSGKPFLFNMFEAFDSSQISHIALAQKSDAIVIAPATANIIGKAANGIADDLLSTIVIAADIPLIFVPGMNNVMYCNKATERNIATLKERENLFFIEPETGNLACGTSGKGRMAEPQTIVEELEKILFPPLSSGIKWLVTGGATREFLDPVRYITNGSSGLTGAAIADAAFKSGGEVTFVSVNSKESLDSSIKRKEVVTALDTATAVKSMVGEVDIFVMSAAVADYTPQKSATKIKKQSGDITLNLSRTEDILLATADVMKPASVRVGFAAETENLNENALAKLKNKKLDLVVANLVSDKFNPFGSVSNSVTFVTESETKLVENIDKYELGEIIVKKALQIFEEKNGK